MKIGIYIYDGAEVLDFSGPFEVFSTASRISKPQGLFEVSLIAETPETVEARGRFMVQPHQTIAQHDPLDVLIIVGGVHRPEMHKKPVLDWISAQAKKVDLLGSVCTGAFLLAAAGVLTDQTVTTHWDDIDDLKTSYPQLNVTQGKRWVDTGQIITSGGISAGIDMSLHLVARLGGTDLAHKTAQLMEFDWRKT